MHAAHQSGPGCTLSGAPRWGFPPLHLRQGSVGFRTVVHPPRARVRVAQSRSHGAWIGSREASQPPAPVAAQRAPLRALRYSACSCRMGSPALVGLVGRPWPVQGRVTVVFGGW